MESPPPPPPPDGKPDGFLAESPPAGLESPPPPDGKPDGFLAESPPPPPPDGKPDGFLAESPPGGSTREIFELRLTDYMSYLYHQMEVLEIKKNVV